MMLRAIVSDVILTSKSAKRQSNRAYQNQIVWRTSEMIRAFCRNLFVEWVEPRTGGYSKLRISVKLQISTRDDERMALGKTKTKTANSIEIRIVQLLSHCHVSRPRRNDSHHPLLIRQSNGLCPWKLKLIQCAQSMRFSVRQTNQEIRIIRWYHIFAAGIMFD